MILVMVPPNMLSKDYFEKIEDLAGEKIIAAGSKKEAAELIPDAEIFVTMGFLDKELIGLAGRLRWVFSLSAGVEHLPFEELSSGKIMVTNTRGIHGRQISEHVMGTILAFSRKLLINRDNQKIKLWKQLYDVDELAGKILCIIGAGSIGGEIARKAKAFDMFVTGIKAKPVKLDYFDEVLGPGGIISSLEKADYTVLSVPLTKDTFHLLGKKEFIAMKKSSYFINISRGDCIDEQSLIDVLLINGISGSGLDVFHEEPLPEESPLWSMDNVLVTPHNSGISNLYFHKAMKIFTDSLKLYRKGEVLPNIIDLERQY